MSEPSKKFWCPNPSQNPTGLAVIGLLDKQPKNARLPKDTRPACRGKTGRGVRDAPFVSDFISALQRVLKGGKISTAKRCARGRLQGAAAWNLEHNHPVSEIC